MCHGNCMYVCTIQIFSKVRWTADGPLGDGGCRARAKAKGGIDEMQHDIMGRGLKVVAAKVEEECGN